MLQNTTACDQSATSFQHIVSNHIEAIHRVVDPDVNLALWRRPVDASIAGEVSTLNALDLPDRRRSTALSTFGQDVRAWLLQRGLNPEHFNGLRTDLGRLARLYFQFNAGRDVHFRLFTTGRDDCRRFHVDRTSLRLLCTYRGPGTEWLTDDQVDRVALARCAPNDAILRFGEPSRFEPFWVGIMRGDPDHYGRGLVHRSPPVEETGDIRVVFCMDS